MAEYDSLVDRRILLLERISQAAGMNEGLDSDFFRRQRPRLEPWSHERYKNAPKRSPPDWSDPDDWRAMIVRRRI